MNSRFQVVTAEDLVVAIKRQRAGLAALAWAPPDRPGEMTLCVHGAHPGVGASSVSVALVDALTRTEGCVATLIDLAEEDGYGASESMRARTDLGMDGWTGGTRGSVRIVRPTADPKMTVDVTGDVVIDVCGRGWGLDLDVLVCRPTMPSIRRAESVLMEEPARVVAVVGASKWPSPVRNGLGPHLRAASSAGGVVFFPHDSALEMNGLTAEPLSPTTLRAACRVLDFVDRGRTAHPEMGQSGGLP